MLQRQLEYYDDGGDGGDDGQERDLELARCVAVVVIAQRDHVRRGGLQDKGVSLFTSAAWVPLRSSRNDATFSPINVKSSSSLLKMDT